MLYIFRIVAWAGQSFFRIVSPPNPLFQRSGGAGVGGGCVLRLTAQNVRFLRSSDLVMHLVRRAPSRGTRARHCLRKGTNKEFLPSHTITDVTVTTVPVLPRFFHCHMRHREFHSSVRHGDGAFRKRSSHLHLEAQSITDPMVQKAIKQYSATPPNPMSIQQFLDFAARKNEPETAFESARFLYTQELPIRTAHMCSIFDNLPQLFRSMPQVKKGRGWYQETFRDILAMKAKFTSKVMTQEEMDAIVDLSIETSRAALIRHNPMVMTMASGLQHLRQTDYVKEIPSYERFLDDLFMCRIGLRLCMTQHINLFSKADQVTRSEQQGDQQGWNSITGKTDCFGRDEGVPPEAHRVRGMFELDMDLKGLVEEAASSARYLCKREFGDAPDVEIKMYVAKRVGRQMTRKKVSSLNFSYVPSHLYHILFELMKNSMKAVTEMHLKKDVDDSDEEMPPIRVILVKAEHDLTIKMEDQGGGVPLARMDTLFRYSFTSSTKPIDPNDRMRRGRERRGTNQPYLGPILARIDEHETVNDERPPMAGFGYGLPLSRLYCRYFGGDLRLVSTEGYGVDSLVYLKSAAADAKETLAVVGQEDEGTHFLSRSDLIEDLRKTKKEVLELRTAVNEVAGIVGKLETCVWAKKADSETG
eukprot:g68954.t1